MGKYERGFRKKREEVEAANAAARAVFEGHPGEIKMQVKIEERPGEVPIVHTLLDCDGSEAFLALAVLLKDVSLSMGGDPGLDLARVCAMVQGAAADMIEAAKEAR